MSDYETFQKWAVEAEEIISDRSTQRGSFILGVSRFELLNWNDPKKAAFMAAIAARRRLKMALDRLHADGLALVAGDAMNELSDEDYGYIDTDTYASGYHDTEQPARMFSHENEQYASYMYSDDLSDSLRTLIEAPSRGLASVWRCETQTAESAPECTVSLGTEEDYRAWAVGDSITFKLDPSDSGVAHQIAPVAGAASDWRERIQKAMEAAMLDAMMCGQGISKSPTEETITYDCLRGQLAQAIAEGVIPGRQNYSGSMTDFMMGNRLYQVATEFAPPGPVEKVFSCAVTDSDDGQHQSR